MIKNRVGSAPPAGWFYLNASLRHGAQAHAIARQYLLELPPSSSARAYSWSARAPQNTALRQSGRDGRSMAPLHDEHNPLWHDTGRIFLHGDQLQRALDPR
jgi:hypothetical protein